DYAHLRRMLRHLCGRLLLWPAPRGRVSGCGSAPSEENERSTAAAMARIDSGSSRTVIVVGEIPAHPAADRIQSSEFTWSRCAARVVVCIRKMFEQDLARLSYLWRNLTEPNRC